jgi:hypothetical protein
MQTVAAAPRDLRRGLTFAALTLVFLAGIVFEVVERGAGYWQLAAFGLGPDLAVVFGAGAGLKKGQLHRRAVPAYNLAHRYWLPLAVLILASAGVLPVGYVVGGLAWCLHISLDRALGYGLRTRNGFQRS